MSSNRIKYMRKIKKVSKKINIFFYLEAILYNFCYKYLSYKKYKVFGFLQFYFFRKLVFNILQDFLKF